MLVSQNQWDSVDEYFNGLFVPSDHALESALNATVEAGMPQISVAPNQGKLLYLLARSHNTKSILEIGTLAGYRTIWLARGVSSRLRSIPCMPKWPVPTSPAPACLRMSK